MIINKTRVNSFTAGGCLHKHKQPSAVNPLKLLPVPHGHFKEDKFQNR